MLPLSRYDPQHTSRLDCSSKQASLEVYECEYENRQMDPQAGHLVCHATESFPLHRRTRLHYVVADGTAAPKQSADSGVEFIAIGGTYTTSWQGMWWMVVVATTLIGALESHSSTHRTVEDDQCTLER